MTTETGEPSPAIEFADAKRIAQITGLSVNHLANLRMHNHPDSPPWFRVGRRVLYPTNGPMGLQGWVDRRLQATGSAK